MKSEHKEMMKARRRNIKLTLSYDGTNYHGFQRQTKVVAVQNVLEGALFKLFGDSIELAAAGRTDAGVHAIGQVVNFFTDGTIPIQNVVRAGNRLLPDDIVLLKAEEADRDFSALHSVKSKIYIYKVFENELADPFMSRFYWHVNKKLNLEEGLYVVEVTEYSSAEKAGLRSGDLIVKADGRRKKTFEELQEVKNSKKEGDSINIEFIRDGKTQNANVTLTPSQTVNN